MNEAAIEQLLDKNEIIEVVTRLFIATDARDWAGVEECLTDPVILDMTSLSGGEPERLSPAQVAEGWRDGLAKVDHLHHQVGNFIVRVNVNDATAFCYGVAFHHRDVTSDDNLRTFVGTYDIHLVRTKNGWRIDLFKFNARFVTGNADLESAT